MCSSPSAAVFRSSEYLEVETFSSCFLAASCRKEDDGGPQGLPSSSAVALPAQQLGLCGADPQPGRPQRVQPLGEVGFMALKCCREVMDFPPQIKAEGFANNQMQKGKGLLRGTLGGCKFRAMWSDHLVPCRGTAPCHFRGEQSGCCDGWGL